MLALMFGLGSATAQANFDVRIGQVYNASQGRPIQRSCVELAASDIQLFAPNRGSLTFATNLSEASLRKSLGIGLEGSFQSGGVAVSGQFSFINAAAKTDFSQTINMLYREDGALASIQPHAHVTLTPFGESSLQLSVAEQEDRCGHAWINSVQYSSGILVNLRTSFANQTKVENFDGLLKIESEYTLEGKLQRVFSRLQEVGRFQLNVYGWGRYAEFVTKILNFPECKEGTDCPDEAPALDAEYCKNEPEICESTLKLRKQLSRSILACNTANNAEACTRAMSSIYEIIKAVQAADSELTTADAVQSFVEKSVPTSYTTRSYIGTFRPQGELVSTWFPQPLSEADLDLIRITKGMMRTDKDRYQREIRDLSAISSLPYMTTATRRVAIDAILQIEAYIQALEQAMTNCESERVTAESCQQAKENAYQKIASQPLATNIRSQLLRMKPFDVICEEFEAHVAVKKEMGPETIFALKQEMFDASLYLLDLAFQKLEPGSSHTVSQLLANFEAGQEPHLFSRKEIEPTKNIRIFDCARLANSIRSLRSATIDGAKVRIIDPLLSQSQLQSIRIVAPQFKIGQIAAGSFPKLRELAFLNAMPQSYASIKDFRFLDRLDISGTSANSLESVNGSKSLRCLIANRSKISRLGLSDLFNLEVLDLRQSPGFLPVDLMQIIKGSELPNLTRIYLRPLGSPQDELGRIDESMTCNATIISESGTERTIICSDKSASEDDVCAN
jgi:hypothetical protein